MLESDLARPPAGGWCWCAESLARAGFIRTDDGSTIAVGPSHAGALPEEIALALAGSGHRPRLVRVDIADLTRIVARGCNRIHNLIQSVGLSSRESIALPSAVECSASSDPA